MGGVLFISWACRCFLLTIQVGLDGCLIECVWQGLESNRLDCCPLEFSIACVTEIVMRISSQRGFTLIELLVVISIIALLVSILLPALGSARHVSQELKCLTQIRQLGFASVMYAEDYKDQYPLPDERGGPNYLSLDSVMSGYDGRPTIKIRPNGTSASAWYEGEVPQGVWQCPLDSLERANPSNPGAMLRSYGITAGPSFESRQANPNNQNARVYTGVIRPVGFIPDGDTWQARQTDIRSPSEVVFMTDWARSTSWMGNATPNDACVVPGWAMGGGFQASGIGWPDNPSMFYAHERTLGSDPLPNGVFADGHAASIDVVDELKAAGNASPFPIFGTDTRGTVFDAMR